MKKTITIGGVEYIDASKEDTITTIIGGFVAVAGVSLLIATIIFHIFFGG